MTHHAAKFDKQALGNTILEESFPKRWKLLITVIDCSHTPRLVNPPRSIDQLKARLSAAVGIADEKHHKSSSSSHGGHGGHQEATAQAIVTGLEGPERRALDSDEDLCLFWENVRSGEAGIPMSRSSTMTSCPMSPMSPLSPLTRKDRRCRTETMQRSETMTTLQSLPRDRNDTLQSARESEMTDTAGRDRGESTSLSRASTKVVTVEEPPELNVVEEAEDEEDYEGAYELNFDEREKEMQEQLDLKEEQRAAAESKAQELQAELEASQQRSQALEDQLTETKEQCASLQEENLQFIKAFDENVEQKMAEVSAELDKKYQSAIQEQGKILADAQSQVRRLEATVEMRDKKIKELEANLREQRSAFTKLASDFEEEREQFQEERKRLAAKVQRVRQLEFFADCWRRKVKELTDVSGKELREFEDSLQYRIGSITLKLEEFQKGRLVQSPEFDVPELGKVQFEFFPTGDVNSRQGWCSFRLRVPDQTRLRWSAFIGKRRIGPRTDHFDQRQWWCRYGLLWLNFVPIDDVRAEVSPQTDTLLCGIEVHEILPSLVGTDGATPVEGNMPVPRDKFGVSRDGEKRANAEQDAADELRLSPAAGAGAAAVRALPSSVGSSPTSTKVVVASKPPAMMPSPQPARKLGRPQSVPSTSWKKHSGR